MKKLAHGIYASEDTWPDEFQLLHVLRIADPGDHLLAAQLLGKRGDDDIGLVVLRSSDQKVVGRDAHRSERRDLLRVDIDGHDIHLSADLLQLVFIYVDDCDRVVSFEECFRDIDAELAGADDCDFHLNTFLNILKLSTLYDFLQMKSSGYVLAFTVAFAPAFAVY